MLAFLKTKLALVLLGTLVVGGLAGTTMALAAHNHAGPSHNMTNGTTTPGAGGHGTPTAGDDDEHGTPHPKGTETSGHGTPEPGD